MRRTPFLGWLSRLATKRQKSWLVPRDRSEEPKTRQKRAGYALESRAAGCAAAVALATSEKIAGVCRPAMPYYTGSVAASFAAAAAAAPCATATGRLPSRISSVFMKSFPVGVRLPTV